MSDLIKSMRRLLFQLWNGHTEHVATEGRRLAAMNVTVERAYTAGFRDGYFKAVSDLVKEGLVDPPLEECVGVGDDVSNREILH